MLLIPMQIRGRGAPLRFRDSGADDESARGVEVPHRHYEGAQGQATRRVHRDEAAHHPGTDDKKSMILWDIAQNTVFCGYSDSG